MNEELEQLRRECEADPDNWSLRWLLSRKTARVGVRRRLCFVEIGMCLSGRASLIHIWDQKFFSPKEGWTPTAVTRFAVCGQRTKRGRYRDGRFPFGNIESATCKRCLRKFMNRRRRAEHSRKHWRAPTSSVELAPPGFPP